MTMLERDYVLRMIQLLARAVAHILGLKRAGQLDDALEAVKVTHAQGRRLSEQHAGSVPGVCRRVTILNTARSA